MHNYLKSPFVKALVKENAYESLRNAKNLPVLSGNLTMKDQVLRPKGVKNVSSVFQSAQNIVINDQKHIFNLNKSHMESVKKH